MERRLTRILVVGSAVSLTAGVVAYSQLTDGAPAAASASSSSTASSGSTPDTGSTASSAAPAAPVVVSPEPVAGSPTQGVFVAGDAATVVLDSAGGSLRVVTLVPHPGWSLVRLDQPTATDLAVQFESASGQIDFAARVADGAVVAEVTVSAPVAASVPDGSGPDNSGTGPDNTGTGPDNTGTGPDNTGPDDDGNSGPGGGGDDSGGDDDSSGSGGG